MRRADHEAHYTYPTWLLAGASLFVGEVIVGVIEFFALLWLFWGSHEGLVSPGDGRADRGAGGVVPVVPAAAPDADDADWFGPLYDNTATKEARKHMDYLVTWEINIEAKSPREAAEKALKIQRNPESIATVFQVWAEDTDMEPDVIDLSEPEEEAR